MDLCPDAVTSPTVADTQHPLLLLVQEEEVDLGAVSGDVNRPETVCLKHCSLGQLLPSLGFSCSQLPLIAPCLSLQVKKMSLKTRLPDDKRTRNSGMPSSPKLSP